MAANVGFMMDGTYFVGRNELLQWINSTLALNLTKIEQTASGAVACQLLDALHPGAVQLHKVDFNSTKDYEFINNYKVLQAAFLKLNIQKDIPINSLVKAKPLDNMEFMQWMKAYFDSQTGGLGVVDYDAATRRAACKTGDVKFQRGPKRPMNGAGSNRPAAAVAPSRQPSAAARRPAANRADPCAPQFRQAPQPQQQAPPDEETEQLIVSMREEAAEMKLKVENAEKERDFYFDKLRDIEILCQAPELAAIPIVKIFERILYAANDVEAKQVIAEAQSQFSMESR